MKIKKINILARKLPVLFFLLIGINLFSQNSNLNDEKYCKVIKFKPSQSFQNEMNRNYSKLSFHLLLGSNLKLNFNEDTAFIKKVYKNEQNDELQSNITITHKIIIELKSGVKWELNGKVPSEVSKKDICDDNFKNRQKYSEFCLEWKRLEKFPYELINDFKINYSICEQDKVIYNANFVYTYDTNGKLIKKEKNLIQKKDVPCNKKESIKLKSSMLSESDTCVFTEMFKSEVIKSRKYYIKTDSSKIRVGDWTEHYKNGHIKNSVQFDKNQIVKYKNYNRNGNLTEELTRSEDFEKIIHNSYRKNGEIKKTKTYELLDNKKGERKLKKKSRKVPILGFIFSGNTLLLILTSII